MPVNVSAGGRLGVCGIVLGTLLAGVWPAPGARAQMGATTWLATSTAAHDVIANCLAQALSREFVTAPVVFAPPKRSAYVNLWPRANQPIDPVATLHVQPERDGSMRIGWQRLANAPDGPRWDAAAKAATDRCATAGR
ncbi:MAG: hypothetical protein KIT36_23570 [Alphaproteobacteria bacterium]|nr:hypothetical protein [Alphaproteobacteria bacterium]